MDNLSESLELGFGGFAALYRRAIARSGKTQDAIAREIGYKNQGFLSLMLNHQATVPPDKLKEWLAPLGLSDDEFAMLYRKGLEEFAPEYVRELIEHFARFHRRVMRGDPGTLPSLEQILAGQMRRRV